MDIFDRANHSTLESEWTKISPRKELTETQILANIPIPTAPGKPSNPLIDEQVWTFLFAYGYRNHPGLLLRVLTEGAASPVEHCRAWMEMMPMPARQGVSGSSEGNTNIDLMVGSIARRGSTKAGVQYKPHGPICVTEAKWQSDIAGATTHDIHRNQFARIIETAATIQHHATDPDDPSLASPSADTPSADVFPNEVYVTLLTPRCFKVIWPASRFYAYKYREYRSDHDNIKADVQSQKIVARKSPDSWRYPDDINNRLEHVRLCWVTYEDLFLMMPDEDGYREILRKFVSENTKLLDPNIFPAQCP